MLCLNTWRSKSHPLTAWGQSHHWHRDLHCNFQLANHPILKFSLPRLPILSSNIRFYTIKPVWMHAMASCYSIVFSYRLWHQKMGNGKRCWNVKFRKWRLRPWKVKMLCFLSNNLVALVLHILELVPRHRAMGGSLKLYSLSFIWPQKIMTVKEDLSQKAVPMSMLDNLIHHVFCPICLSNMFLL